MSSFDIFRTLIKLHKQDELNYETFCDAVDEFSSDQSEQRKLALGISKYLENLEYYNFSDVKTLSMNSRERLERGIIYHLTDYLVDHPYSEEWQEKLDTGSEFEDDE